MSESNFSSQQYMEVPCIRCDAKIGERCWNNLPGNGRTQSIGFHVERCALRAKMPVAMPDAENLSPTDKALITYYAFVMVCDSCETKSLELFGKQFTSQEIQRFFAKQAIQELRKDGLLK